MLLVGFLNSWETLILKGKNLSIPVELLPLSKRIKNWVQCPCFNPELYWILCFGKLFLVVYILILNALNFSNFFYFIQEQLATLKVSDNFSFTANLVCSFHTNIKNHFGVFAFLIAVTLWVDWSAPLTERAVQEHGNLPSGGSELGTAWFGEQSHTQTEGLRCADYSFSLIQKAQQKVL